MKTVMAFRWRSALQSRPAPSEVTFLAILWGHLRGYRGRSRKWARRRSKAALRVADLQALVTPGARKYAQMQAICRAIPVDSRRSRR